MTLEMSLAANRSGVFFVGILHARRLHSCDINQLVAVGRSCPGLSLTASLALANIMIDVNQYQSERLAKMAPRAVHAIQRLPITKARVNLGQLARRAHVNKEYFILEKDGIPVIGIMDADELEDYLELRDGSVAAVIRQSTGDVKAGRVRPAEVLPKQTRPEGKKKGTRPRRQQA